MKKQEINFRRIGFCLWTVVAVIILYDHYYLGASLWDGVYSENVVYRVLLGLVLFASSVLVVMPKR